MEKSRRRLAPITLLLIIITLLFAAFFWGYFTSLSDLYMQVISSSETEDHKPFRSLLSRLVKGEYQTKLETTGYACDFAENSLVCLSNRPVRIDTHNNVTVYTSTLSMKEDEEETIVRPYALQKEKDLLQSITPVTILHGSNTPPVCQYNHPIPAVIFSSGLTGNLFHEFNDIIIPLFITVKHFQSQVLLILEDYNPTFVSKYRKIISRLSSYEAMNPAANASVHCFPGFIVGLKSHDYLALNSSDTPQGYSTRDFRMFLRETYNLKFKHVSEIRKPTVMLISRETTRKFLNEDEIVDMIQRLGFSVIVGRTKEATDLDKFANMTNSCTVLVGAHGAGLTNELFLPAGAAIVQVEPLGLKWASDHYFGNPARGMDLHYLPYRIEPEESSLVEMYGRNNSVIMDPGSIFAKGYVAARTVYIDQQNVRVDITRFRKTMLQAVELIKNASLTR